MFIVLNRVMTEIDHMDDDLEKRRKL
jgi:hypothetical protein